MSAKTSPTQECTVPSDDVPNLVSDVEKNRTAETDDVDRSKPPDVDTEPSEESADEAPTDNEAEAPKKAASQFEVRLGGLRQSRKEDQIFKGPGAASVLSEAIKADVDGIEEPHVTWKNERAAVAIDIDKPKGDPGIPHRTSLDRYFPDTLPKPLAAWVTHSGGLRVIFVGVDEVDANSLAGAWVLLAPLGPIASWRIEVLCHTRHPGGLRGEQTCGEVHWFAPSSNLRLPSDAAASVSEEQIQNFMEERGICLGRSSTEDCLICAKPDATSRNDVILIGEAGVKCFRCDKYKSWTNIIGGQSCGALKESADHLVHFPHQRLVLMQLRPSVPDSLLRPAWKFMLERTNESWIEDAGDDKVAEQRRQVLDRAAGSAVDLVRGLSGGWYDAATLQPRALSAHAAKVIPYTSKGLPPLLVDKLMGTGEIAGLTPAHIVPAEMVLGPHVEPPPGSVVARKPLPLNAPPAFQLTENPPAADSVDAAWKAVTEKLPGLCRGYLSAVIVAIWVAQRGRALPPIIVVTGDSGSAKTVIQDLAASMVGSFAVGVTLSDPEDAFRQIGLALESGAAAIFADEIARTPGMYSRLESILRLRHIIQFKPLYSNERKLPMTAPVSLISSTLPSAVTKSPELSRRAVGFRLLEEAPHWNAAGNLAHARSIESLRPALDLITSSLWWLLYEEGADVDWRALCFERFNAVGIEHLDLQEDEAGINAGICALYEHYRTAPDKEITTGNRQHGWLDASVSRPAHGLVADLIDVEGDKRAIIAETEDLKRRKLGPILGFDDPQLKLSIRKRGAQWLVKFLETRVARGRERTRSELPPLGQPPPPPNTPTPPPSRTLRITNDLEKTASQRVAHVAHVAHTQTSLNIKIDTKTGTTRDDDRPDDRCKKGSDENPCATSATCVTRPDAAPAGSQHVRHGAPRPQLVFLDFETRSRVDLQRVGGRLYAEDPTTEVLCMAAALPDGSELQWTPKDAPPGGLFACIEAGAHVVAHNGVDFDRHIWRRLGWPEPARWIDTLHLARLAGLPGKLDDVAKIILGEGKDDQGAAVLADLRRPDAKTGKVPHVDKTRLQTVQRYCLKDVLLMKGAFEKRLHWFDGFDVGARIVDEAINGRGFCFDADLAGNVIKMAGALQVEAENASRVDGSVLRSAKKLKAVFAGAGIAIANTKNETLVALLEDEDLPADIRLVIEAKTLSGKRIRQKLERGLDSLSADGRSRDSLVYHGAHTARWAGRGFQPHNLARGIDLEDEAGAVAAAMGHDLVAVRQMAAEHECKPEEFLDSLIRRCIVAPAGQSLVVVDYSSIEARGLAWLVRDDVKLGDFRLDLDLYKVLASKLFGVDYGEVSKAQRGCGKIGELGCGYQMGAARLESYGAGLNIDWSLGVSPEDVVNGWRDSNPLVAGTRTGEFFKGHLVRAGGFWKDIEAAFTNVTKHRGTIELNRLVIEAIDNDVHCILPSGRRLVYRDMRLEPGKTNWGTTKIQLSYARDRGRSGTYGGKLTENIVQAISRDLLADALVRLEGATDAVTVLHVHDEVVLETPTAGAEVTLKQVEAIMCTPPTWAADFPIAVKPFLCQRYRK